MFKDQLKLGELYRIEKDDDMTYYYTNEVLLEAGIVIKEEWSGHSDNLQTKLTLYHHLDNAYFRCTLYDGNIANSLFLLGIVNTTYELFKKSEHIEIFLHALFHTAEGDIEHTYINPQEHPGLEGMVLEIEHALLEVIKVLKPA